MRTIIKPKLRDEARLELSSAILNAAANIMESTANFPYKTCIRCDNFNEEKEICKLYNARPPAKIIAFGCEKFSDEHWIPF